MIVSQLAGGLGNQLFQYAFGRSLSLRLGQPLKLDIAPLQRDRQRVYMLDRLNVRAEIADQQSMDRYRRRPRVHRRLRDLLLPGELTPIREGGHGFDAGMLERRGSFYVIGYFQSERYFADYACTIREDFALLEAMSAERSEVAKAIRGCNAVSVHVRRGDYLANSLLAPLSPTWYGPAMARMAGEVAGAPTFFVFSDDPAWSRANLPQIGPMVFVEPQSDGRDEQDMHLMSFCRHHIIANSTFSWWGAWLNPSPDKRVIAPRQWFSSGSTLDARDIVPAAWERL